MLKLSKIFLVSAMVLGAGLSGCATTSDSGPKEVKQPPVISKDMKLEDALQAGIEFGGDTARSVRKLVTKRKEWPLAEKFLTAAIQDGIIKYENIQLVNSVMLYVAGPVKPSEVLFQKLVTSGRPLARQLGWQMAAALPGKVMRSAIEREMNRALVEGEESDILIPQMANAVQSNRMVGAYTMVREGLMTTGHEDFASAMATLNPEQASTDFIDYLAICPPEELRQMTLSSVNVYSATIALNHLIKHPPNMSNPRLETIFYYSISRNSGLADLGMTLVDQLSTGHRQQMAVTLSRLPAWAQVAFVESSRRNLSPGRRVFLGELRNLSPQSEVVDELGELKM